ncbi:tetratricopeptide repeat protein [Azohydromonas caseinilytica]|uniref:Tetratricopeptide repeat protein 38 n=1 Tax=Azohydromonas caseinilytica TaxID=2728836 RepID=A0A848FH38_9BURK|nr:tetratricopeptide repeat protein [Azohydromonas caseinilytica]NML17573.1 tetratricopeptide repeat protein [Azohydromonas caseinilytica]
MNPLHDATGHALTGATPAALDAWEQAAHELRCLVGDPAASIERALEAAPEMPMAHAFKAWLYLLGTEPEGLPVARAACEAGAALPASERERMHLHAAALLAQGRWHEAARALEDLSLQYPRDALALQAGHQVDFFTGDSRMLRDRVARALPAWDASMPGYHAVLGMHAFGLEETGDYVQAEAQGRRAVELESRDSWAWHAVAHTLEMRNRPADGIAWLEPNSASWAPGSFLGVHNWWHLALFHLELDHHDEVLRLYDEAIAGSGLPQVLDLIDASAMLWRLQLRGLDVGARWQPLADRWAPLVQASRYAFNDLHAMLAFTGAGRRAEQQRLLEAQAAALETGDDNAGFIRDVGGAATRAVMAYGNGDYAPCVALLRPIRHRAHRFGGSHAQRDLLDLTLIEAALRGGDQALARGLTAERLAVRPASALAQRLVRRSGEG